MAKTEFYPYYSIVGKSDGEEYYILDRDPDVITSVADPAYSIPAVNQHQLAVARNMNIGGQMINLAKFVSELEQHRNFTVASTANVEALINSLSPSSAKVLKALHITEGGCQSRIIFPNSGPNGFPNGYQGENATHLLFLPAGSRQPDYVSNATKTRVTTSAKPIKLNIVSTPKTQITCDVYLIMTLTLGSTVWVNSELQTLQVKGKPVFSAPKPEKDWLGDVSLFNQQLNSRGFVLIKCVAKDYGRKAYKINDFIFNHCKSLLEIGSDSLNKKLPQQYLPSGIRRQYWVNGAVPNTIATMIDAVVNTCNVLNNAITHRFKTPEAFNKAIENVKSIKVVKNGKTITVNVTPDSLLLMLLDSSHNGLQFASINVQALADGMFFKSHDIWVNHARYNTCKEVLNG